MVFDVGFLLDVGTSLTLHFIKISLNFQPVNSPPLSCMQRLGHGYLASQVLASALATVSDFLLSTRTISVRFVTGSITVSARKVTTFLPILTSQGPIKSIGIL